MLAELCTGLLDEGYPVLIKLLHTGRRDNLWHRQKPAIFHPHNIIDLPEVTFNGRSDDAEIAYYSGVLIL